MRNLSVLLYTFKDLVLAKQYQFVTYGKPMHSTVIQKLMLNL
jgi:hypothetical protein